MNDGGGGSRSLFFTLLLSSCVGAAPPLQVRSFVLAWLSSQLISLGLVKPALLAARVVWAASGFRAMRGMLPRIVNRVLASDLRVGAEGACVELLGSRCAG